ncbi:MAG: hypothetical protein D6715_11345 [Calditrichaeota bacterium]|nr:MAG: hypothetical protein D6715_11345 [Calditrichota bacterium]
MSLMVQKKRRKPARKRGKRRGRRPVVYSVRQATRGLSTVVMIFSLFLVASLGFLLFQWKEYLLTKYNKDIQLLTEEVYRLRSERSELESEIKSSLTQYHRIARIGREKLGLEQSLRPPAVLVVDGKKLKRYARKDAQTVQ